MILYVSIISTNLNYMAVKINWRNSFFNMKKVIWNHTERPEKIKSSFHYSYMPIQGQLYKSYFPLYKPNMREPEVILLW